MSKIRVGVVGVGALGQHHARLYSTLQDVELVGVADTHPGRAAEIAGPLSTQAHTDYCDLFGKVDAIRGRGPIVCTGAEGKNTLELALQVLQKAEHAQASALNSGAVASPLN